MRSAVASRSHCATAPSTLTTRRPPALLVSSDSAALISATSRRLKRVDQRGEIGDRAGAPVQLGNQHGADLAAVYGAHDPLPPWPVKRLRGGARVHYHVDQLEIVQRGQRFQLDPLRCDAEAGVGLLLGADPDVADCLAAGVGVAGGVHAWKVTTWRLLVKHPTDN